MPLSLNISALQACITNLKSQDKLIDGDLIRRQDPSFAHFDWAAGELWTPILQSSRSLPSDYLLRLACRHFVITNPLLLQLVGGGRSAVVMNLSNNEKQVFENANLLEANPSLHVVEWWDSLKILSRSQLNESLLAQGRLAERWTMEEEEKYLMSIGSDLRPEWVSLESDQYGYDIESHRFHPNGRSYTIQIEVKSYSKKSDPHIFITDYEWQRAEKIGESYIFQVWCTEDRSINTYTIKHINPHIPQNCRNGKWKNVLIKLR